MTKSAMTTADVLVKAKALCTPERWFHPEQGRPWVTGRCECVATAIEHTTNNWDLRMEAFAVFKRAVHWRNQITDWNDAPDRTYAEVVAGFDAAIALSQLRGELT